MDKSKMETRYLEVSCLEVETREDNQAPKLVGYAHRYNTMSLDLGGFKERFALDAFKRSLESDIDVIALAQHDNTKVLGRASAGTLKVENDSVGLRVEITPPNNSYGNDILESIRRNDITGMSFGFIATEEELVQEGEEWIREVKDADLYEVSIVTTGAYSESRIQVRKEVIEKLEELKKPTEKEFKPSEKMLDQLHKQKLAEFGV